MARILKRRGLYEVRGGTREPRPRDPGMTAQQAISTASSALRLGTQVAGLIGQIPVKDARAKKLEALEAAKQVNVTQRTELENQKKVAKANAMQRTPDALVGAVQQAAAGVQQSKDAYAQAVDASIAEGSRDVQSRALPGGISFEEMSKTTERISGLPNAAFARKQVVDGVVSETVLPGQEITPPGRVGGYAMPPGQTREDITRPNMAILDAAERIGGAFMPTEEERTLGLPAPADAKEKVAYDAMLRDEELKRRGVMGEFSLNPKEKIVEIDTLWMKLRDMKPANVEEHQIRVREMGRLQDAKNILLSMGRMGTEMKKEAAAKVATAATGIESAEFELTEAQDAVKSFESARKDKFEGQQRVFSEREKLLNADLEKIQSQMPDLKRTLADIIADARFAKTEKEKRKLMKEAASVINPRNVKESVFGVDELKLKAVEKVLNAMPKALSEKDIQAILNKKSLIESRDAKRKRDEALHPDKLTKLRNSNAYKKAKTETEDFLRSLKKEHLQAKIDKLNEEHKRIKSGSKKKGSGFTAAVNTLRATLITNKNRLQKMVDDGEHAKAFRDRWADVKPTAPVASKFAGGKYGDGYQNALKAYRTAIQKWNNRVIDANVNYDLFGAPGKLRDLKAGLKRAKKKLSEFVARHGEPPIETPDNRKDFP